MCSDPYGLLELLAKTAAHDISSDFPDKDTTYELWVEELRRPAWLVTTYGVITMGDLYDAVYVWVDGSWFPTGYDADVIIEEIIAKRESRSF